MNVPHGEVAFLPTALALLGAAVISVPVARTSAFRRSSLISSPVSRSGRSAFACSSTAEQVLPVAELGIVMLMFVIGMELEVSPACRDEA